MLICVHTSVRNRVHILYTCKRTQSICAKVLVLTSVDISVRFIYVYSHIQCMRILCMPISCVFVILIFETFVVDTLLHCGRLNVSSRMDLSNLICADCLSEPPMSPRDSGVEPLDGHPHRCSADFEQTPLGSHPTRRGVGSLQVSLGK